MLTAMKAGSFPSPLSQIFIKAAYFMYEEKDYVRNVEWKM
jgi:hypothetical protein